MLNVMYEVPARKDVEEVVIPDDTIESGEPAKVISGSVERTGT